MNENKAMVILKWAVVLLVICNIGLMLTIWLKPALPYSPHGETPRDFVIRSLKFTNDQTKKYDVLVHEHQQAMGKLRNEAMEYRQLLFANLKNENKGGTNTDSLAQLIANNQKQIELVTYQHFGQVRALCTETQKPKFDNIIGDVIKKMNGPMHGGPHPPPPGEGPPPEGGDHPLSPDGPPN